MLSPHHASPLSELAETAAPNSTESGILVTLAPWIIGLLIALSVVVTVGLLLGYVLSGARGATGQRGEAPPVVLSPYNAALVEEITEQAEAYRSGRLESAALQAYVSSRVSLFENDRSGVRDASLVLEGEIESVRFRSCDERGDTMRALDAFLSRYDPPTGPETPLR